MLNDSEGQSDSTDLAMSRRDVVKDAAAVTAAGALGTLSGCIGGSGGGDNGNSSSGGGSETNTLSYLTPDPTESPGHKEFYQDQMNRFGEREENVDVNLQSMGWGTLEQKLPAMAKGDNLPDVAMSGATGLQLYLEEDSLIDHGSFIEGTEGIPENFRPATANLMQYRDEWWSSGSMYTQATMGAVRPKFFKEVGVTDPSTLETWTGFRRAVDRIDKQFPEVYAFEETGVAGDLESYWGEARTAYTDGADPWIDVTNKGSYQNPHVKVGKEPRTDGIIKNCIEMGLTYSSPEVATRSNEGVPPLLLTDQAASYLHALGRLTPWTAVESDVTFGWDGDIHIMPIPRLDSNYGNEFGIEELAGESGQPGGNGWGYDIMHTGFKSTAPPENAWALMDYVNRNPEFVLPYLGEVQTTAPAVTELLEPLRSQYEIAQPQEVLFDVLEEWPDQYQPTGAEWDVPNTGQIRFTDINETISQALSGQIEKSQAPKTIRSKIMSSLNSS